MIKGLTNNMLRRKPMNIKQHEIHGFNSPPHESLNHISGIFCFGGSFGSIFRELGLLQHLKKEKKMNKKIYIRKLK